MMEQQIVVQNNLLSMWSNILKKNECSEAFWVEEEEEDNVLR